MLYLAALLFFLLGLAHSFLGERYILIRLFRRNDLPKIFGGTEFTTRTLRFAWHITTVAWWGLASMLVLAARGELNSRSALVSIAFIALLSATLPLIITKGRHLSWLVLIAIAALIYYSGAG